MNLDRIKAIVSLAGTAATVELGSSKEVPLAHAKATTLVVHPSLLNRPWGIQCAAVALALGKMQSADEALAASWARAFLSAYQAELDAIGGHSVNWATAVASVVVGQGTVDATPKDVRGRGQRRR